jgi:hypothetical protein
MITATPMDALIANSRIATNINQQQVCSPHPTGVPPSLNKQLTEKPQRAARESMLRQTPAAIPLICTP